MAVQLVKIVTGIDHDLKDLGTPTGLKITLVGFEVQTENGQDIFYVKDPRVLTMLEKIYLLLLRLEEKL